MSSIKQYHDKNVVVRYHPDERVIHLQLKKGQDSSALRKIEDKLKTTLSVDSTDSKGPDQAMLTLSQTAQEASVHEFLQTVLQGGKETGDAVSGEEEDQSQVQPPMPPQPGVMPGGAPPTTPGQLPMESFSVVDVYSMLMESAKGPRYTSVLKEATYRTGEHWDLLAHATGKGKQKIDDRDILSLRRSYTKKKRSRSRDRVLRALDKVSRYFARKLRNTMGPEAAQMFKDKYKKIGDLTPLDYAEDKPGDTEIETPDPQQGFDPSSVDFSEFFPKEKEEPIEPQDDEGEEEAPEEKYGDEPEEEYPD